jgi:uncharacterized membrane protein YfcA
MLALAALLVGVVKGGLGPMPGALLVPLLSTTMPVAQAVGATLPMLIVGDWFALPVYWRKWDGQALRLMLPAAVLGVGMGVTLLTTLPDDTLRRVLGAFTLIIALYKLGSDTLSAMTYRPRTWHGWLAGWGSGFGSALANVGAPPITAYLLLRRTAPTTFIGTTVIFFLVVNLLKLPVFVITDVLDGPTLLRTLWTLPLIPLGVWLGKELLRHIPQRPFEWLMLGLLFWMGGSLLLG